MTAHQERQHALLSASGSGRWLRCTPSARLEEQFPDTTSEAASEGTLAHELAELKLRHYADTTNFTRRKYAAAVNKLKKDPQWKDEMDRYTEEYLDYIRTAALAMKCTPSVRVEERVRFARYTHEDPGNQVEGSGIADCILVGGDTIHVIDLKYGKGVQVDADHNPQLMLYALGAYDACRILYPVTKVKVTIVQPRLDSISEWECSLEDLLKFGEYVKQRAALAWEGKGPYNPGTDTCRFCRAKAVCRARADHNTKLAFGIGEMPPTITAEEAGERLLALEDIAKYQKDLQEWALGQCLAGKEVPGWKAVEGRGSRDWTDMDAAFEILQGSGIDEALLYERRPLTLAQVEKVVGKKEFQETVGEYVTKKPGKPALVQEKDKRPAITNKITAGEAFKEEI